MYKFQYALDSSLHVCSTKLNKQTKYSPYPNHDHVYICDAWNQTNNMTKKNVKAICSGAIVICHVNTRKHFGQCFEQQTEMLSKCRQQNYSFWINTSKKERIKPVHTHAQCTPIKHIKTIQ